jgi:EAL domain-containing protein (putative c-di-GMP-specific phosphodiesterase class I)
LARGPLGEPAHFVFEQVHPENRLAFDEASRVGALRLAAELGLPSALNLNAQPRSLLAGADALTATLTTADQCGVAPRRIVIEVTEDQIIEDLGAFAESVSEFRRFGVQFAIDDFGAGFAGLTLLAEFVPDYLKLDMALVRGIESNGPRQAIARGIVQTCRDLGVDVIAEGIETVAEYNWFLDAGVKLFQGYFFGRPSFEQLAPPVWP